MTDPAYAEEAAALLRLASADNAGRDEKTTETMPPDHPYRRELREERLRIAEGFIALAAIERGEVTDISRSYELPAPGDIVTDYQFRARSEARNAIARLVKDAGGQMVTRPLIRSEPAGRTTQEPAPLAGITAAVAIERAARWYCLESVRYAREDGLTWQAIGDALGFRVTAVDPDDHGAGESVARLAYEYANPGSRYAGWFTWTCPSCAGLVRDYGPDGGSLHDAEQGHAEDCSRFAEAVRKWQEEWDDE